MSYPEYCGRWCMVRWPNDGQPIIVVRWFCGSWECGACGRRKAAKWYAVTLAGHQSAPDLTKFVTLTTDYGREEDAASAWAEQGKRWNRFAATVRKLHYPDLEYIRVLERTKKDYPHVHALMRMPFLAQATLSHWAALAGFGAVCYITKPRDDAHAGRYVVKYLWKAVAQPIPPPTRRISISAHWPPSDWRKHKNPKDEGGEWQLMRRDVDDMARVIGASGKPVNVLDYARLARDETAVANGE